MTDNTTNVEIDTEQLAEYIRQYRETDDREQQRELENRVLAETVWRTPTEPAKDEFSFSQRELEIIHDELPEDALEARRLLRRGLLDF
ncbi:hypothetical protein [Haloarcula nitratireducens]|uniref:Uncharacterized protein n=1 Tax=Haloarcula nitratireducens TaxID=2487749 RepID=A0AAW4PC16_9EURY|nr:hypothetical protein [Halomicroarcula nitratireducens]MBX0295439.1 hypothetical protein [Halomicroarcula nitratireducens]